MKILVLNAGSSTLKFKFFDGKKVVSEGVIDKVKSHNVALKKVLGDLPSTPDAVGHRVVHGGTKHTSATKIDRPTISHIKKMSKLAPLHNPANLAGILAINKLLPKTPQVAVFDTAFHQSMPAKSYTYPLPEKLTKKHNIRRYGFHGTSHKYVIDETLKLLKKRKSRIICCHLGNGSSITAFNKDHVIDTSMGFTPLEGLTMGTRSGSIDPAIITNLQKTTHLSPTKIDQILNNESGLKALTGTNDMRKIYQKYKKKDAKATLAIELLSYQIAKYLGAYTAAMNGVDAITFTGGMGIKAHYIRKKSLEYLKFLGLSISPSQNKEELLTTSDYKKISTPKSKVKVFVIKTNEELQIAQETKKLLSL